MGRCQKTSGGGGYEFDLPLQGCLEGGVDSYFRGRASSEDWGEYIFMFQAFRKETRLNHLK